MRVNSSAAARAAVRSLPSIMISTPARSTSARATGVRFSCSVCRIAASAASICPCASRSNARPGCGLRPLWLAVRYSVLRLVEIAAHPVKLGELIVGRAGVAAVGRPVAPLARLLGFDKRFLPRAVELEQFGSVNQALPTEWHHVRVRRAPPGQRGGPFVCASEIEPVVTDANHAAVHDPRDDWRDLAAGDRDHHLVERREPLRRSCSQEQHAPLAMARHRGRSQSRNRAAISAAWLEGCPCAVDVTGPRALKSQCTTQQAALGTICRVLVEQPSRAVRAIRLPAPGSAGRSLHSRQRARSRSAPRERASPRSRNP